MNGTGSYKGKKHV